MFSLDTATQTTNPLFVLYKRIEQHALAQAQPITIILDSLDVLVHAVDMPHQLLDFVHYCRVLLGSLPVVFCRPYLTANCRPDRIW